VLGNSNEVPHSRGLTTCQLCSGLQASEGSGPLGPAPIIHCNQGSQGFLAIQEGHISSQVTVSVRL
jgi:hypothetical protein